MDICKTCNNDIYREWYDDEGWLHRDACPDADQHNTSRADR